MPNILKSPTVGRLVDDSSRPARRPVFDVYAHEIGAKNRHQKTGTSKMSLRRLTCNLLPNFSGIIFGNEYGHALFSCLFMETVFFWYGFSALISGTCIMRITTRLTSRQSVLKRSSILLDAHQSSTSSVHEKISVSERGHSSQHMQTNKTYKKEVTCKL